MGKLATLTADTPPAGRCKFGYAIDKHFDDDDRAALQNDGLSNSLISAILRQEYDTVVSPDVIGRHRRGACACG